MSVSVSIDVCLKDAKKNRYPTVDIVRVLMENGWRLYFDSVICYKPLGSEEWSYGAIDFSDLAKIFVMKEAAHESNGVMMNWQDTEIGGDFFFRPDEISDKTFSLLLNAERPTVSLYPGYEVTDFQWYLERLLPPINDAFGVECFSYKYCR